MPSTESKLERLEPVIPEQEQAEQLAQPAALEHPHSIGRASEIPVPLVSVVLPTSPALPPPKSQALEEIETILSEDLNDVYAELDLPARNAFKIAGEDAARKINAALCSAKVQFRDILRIILQWLKAIPGLNWAFVEQEAKMKTDKLLRLKSKDDV